MYRNQCDNEYEELYELNNGTDGRKPPSLLYDVRTHRDHSSARLDSMDSLVQNTVSSFLPPLVENKAKIQFIAGRMEVTSNTDFEKLNSDINNLTGSLTYKDRQRRRIDDAIVRVRNKADDLKFTSDEIGNGAEKSLKKSLFIDLPPPDKPRHQIRAREQQKPGYQGLAVHQRDYEDQYSQLLEEERRDKMMFEKEVKQNLYKKVKPEKSRGHNYDDDWPLETPQCKTLNQDQDKHLYPTPPQADATNKYKRKRKTKMKYDAVQVEVGRENLSLVVQVPDESANVATNDACVNSDVNRKSHNRRTKAVKNCAQNAVEITPDYIPHPPARPTVLKHDGKRDNKVREVHSPDQHQSKVVPHPPLLSRENYNTSRHSGLKHRHFALPEIVDSMSSAGHQMPTSTVVPHPHILNNTTNKENPRPFHQPSSSFNTSVVPHPPIAPQTPAPPRGWNSNVARRGVGFKSKKTREAEEAAAGNITRKITTEDRNKWKKETLLRKD